MLANRVASPVTTRRLFFSTAPAKSVATALGGFSLSGPTTSRVRSRRRSILSISGSAKTEKKFTNPQEAK